MPRYSDQQLDDALRECKGMVYVAARRLGCSFVTIKTRLEKSSRLQATVEAERGLLGDTAELKLAQAIQNGEAWAIQFYLKTQHRHRGYVERVEQEHSGTITQEHTGAVEIHAVDYRASIRSLNPPGAGVPELEDKAG